MPENGYNLEERTAGFGEDVIIFCRELKPCPLTESIIKQLIRSSTSVGANYMEANGACSKSDFRNKIYICKKEAMETKHWLRMLSTAIPKETYKLRKLWNEAQELTLIFSKIANSASAKK